MEGERRRVFGRIVADAEHELRETVALLDKLYSPEGKADLIWRISFIGKGRELERFRGGGGDGWK